MKWFKHMTDMSQDVKLKRVIRKFGVQGYGLYCYILELIVRKIETEKPLPDLEETSKDIASDLQMDTVQVEEIMWFCIEQGLFEQDELTGRLCAHKVYKFIETSQTRSFEIKKMIEKYKSLTDKQLNEKHTDMSQTVSDSQRLSIPEQKRIEQNRIEESKKTTTNKIIHEKTGKPMNATRYSSLVSDYGKATVDDYIQRVSDWCDSRGKDYKDVAAAAANWIRKDGVRPLTSEPEGIKLAKKLTMED